MDRVEKTDEGIGHLHLFIKGNGKREILLTPSDSWSHGRGSAQLELWMETQPLSELSPEEGREQRQQSP